MKINKIIHIYCSLKDCIYIKQSIPLSQNGYILSLNSAQIETSIKQIRKVQLKSKCSQGDYLILIDNPQNLLFIDDFSSDNIKHFSCIDVFLNWISSLRKGESL